MINKIYSQLENEQEKNVFVEEIEKMIKELHELESQNWLNEKKLNSHILSIKQELKDIEELNNIDLNLWF